MSPSILVADDDEEMREILEYKLSNSYDVEVVADGDECWEYLQDHTSDPPDLLVLDVMMPGMDGFRLLDRIKDEPAFEELEIIMLTSRRDEDDVVRALDSGATDYMTKPFASSELLARIEQLF